MACDALLFCLAWLVYFMRKPQNSPRPRCFEERHDRRYVDEDHLQRGKWMRQTPANIYTQYTTIGLRFIRLLLFINDPLFNFFQKTIRNNGKKFAELISSFCINRTIIIIKNILKINLLLARLYTYTYIWFRETVKTMNKGDSSERIYILTGRLSCSRQMKLWERWISRTVPWIF